MEVENEGKKEKKAHSSPLPPHKTKLPLRASLRLITFDKTQRGVSIYGGN